jgi:hypothetical protein
MENRAALVAQMMVRNVVGLARSDAMLRSHEGSPRGLPLLSPIRVRSTIST